ncbi:hypothetical protein F471_01349 [Pseudomonas sp. URMO17WK12:I1]|uniref:hypothetical protein n=1 Tax=unclassified Pseudomonas TaxID=196821 RepID=UPI0004B60021|nr:MULTISPECIES: hypothetical protein [unclassified Pseudomonas]PZW70013.1 hypothetical protein F471_01349 [Pseudomonas sp. URMO17WK12:I1]
MRYLLLPLCLAVLLSACGSDEQGKDVPRKNAEPAVAVEPAQVPAKPAEQSPEPAPQAAPAAPTQAAEPQTEAVQKPAPAEPKKTAQRAKAQSKPAQKMAHEAPKTKLDLSLPPELAAALDAEDKAAKDGVAPILPAFFEERKPSINPFQVSGKLLTGELGSQTWDSVEGAQLQFEFRR